MARDHALATLKGRCLSADPGAIPAAIVLAYESRLRALATGLAWARPKYTGLHRFTFAAVGRALEQELSS